MQFIQRFDDPGEAWKGRKCIFILQATSNISVPTPRGWDPISSGCFMPFPKMYTLGGSIAANMIQTGVTFLVAGPDFSVQLCTHLKILPID